MNIFHWILLFLISVIVLILLLAWRIKRNYSVKRDILINTSSKKAYDFLRMLRNQEQFNKWAKTDPNREWHHQGEDGTVGFIISWKGNKDAGEGAKEIMNLIENKKIETQLRFVKPMKLVGHVDFELEYISENQTKISMVNYGTIKYPMNIFIPFAEKNFPKDMEESLRMLKNILEA